MCRKLIKKLETENWFLKRELEKYRMDSEFSASNFLQPLPMPMPQGQQENETNYFNPSMAFPSYYGNSLRRENIWIPPQNTLSATNEPHSVENYPTTDNNIGGVIDLNRRDGLNENLMLDTFQRSTVNNGRTSF